eukprot:gene12574-6394_t
MKRNNLLLFLFFILLSFTSQKTLKEQIYEVVSDPLVQKLTEKIIPLKIDDESPTPDGVIAPKILLETKKNFVYSDISNIKTCYNGGIPVSYFQGNSTHNSTTQACICPLHTVDHNCGYFRLHRCTNVLKHPLRNCEFPQGFSIGQDFLSGDHPCFWFHSNDTIDFYFQVSCKFTAIPSYLQNFPSGVEKVTNLITNETNTIVNFMKNFTYEYKSMDGDLNASFALATIPANNFEFRAYNFYELTDESSTFTKTMTVDHFEGSPIHFQIWFGNFSSSFFAGNRAYVEIGGRYLNFDVESLFFDFTNLRDPGAEYPFIDSIKYIGIGTGIGFGVVILGFASMCFFVNKYGEEKELRK